MLTSFKKTFIRIVARILKTSRKWMTISIMPYNKLIIRNVRIFKDVDIITGSMIFAAQMCLSLIIIQQII